MRYRGKFALKFLLKWLDCLAQEYVSRKTDLFSEIDRAHTVRNNEVTMGLLASRSKIPAGLAAFLSNINFKSTA
jgi:hypothetical protein